MQRYICSRPFSRPWLISRPTRIGEVSVAAYHHCYLLPQEVLQVQVQERARPLQPTSARPWRGTGAKSHRACVLPVKRAESANPKYLASESILQTLVDQAQCTGERPKCGTCITRGTACHYATTSKETHSQALKRKYDELQTQQSPFEELFDILKTKSETEAMEILRRIRAGGSAEAIVRHVKDGDLLMQLSLMPETRQRYDFPYVKDMPVSVLRPDNFYLDSWVYQVTLKDHAPQNSDLETTSLPNQSAYFKPYHAAEIVDPVLSNAVVSNWTVVTSDNSLLRRLIGCYLLYQCPWSAAFQKDSFLEDLVAGRDELCSSLLVNAVLAVSCVSASKSLKTCH